MGVCPLIQPNDEVYIDVEKAHSYWRKTLEYISNKRGELNKEQIRYCKLIGLLLSQILACYGLTEVQESLRQSLALALDSKSAEEIISAIN